TQVNLAFFELGREIITENALDVDEAPPVGLLIRQTTRELEQKFGLRLPKEMLQNMVDFAAVCKEATLVAVVARFLTWQQIQVLLPFQSVSLINYYVNNFASNPSDIQGFKKRVNEEAAQVLASLPAPAAPENPFPLLVTIGKQSVQESNRPTILSNIDYTSIAGPQAIGNAIFSDSALIQFLALY
ncbi:MAG TPA: hypothetical protein VL307_13600, partial [Chitinophagaceae bacterium]|nr:hypothetical protein [Chitinophagaceae bacterium]